MATWIEEEGEIPEEYIGKEVQDMEQVYEEPQWQSRSGEIPTDYLGREEQQYAETTESNVDPSVLRGKVTKESGGFTAGQVSNLDRLKRRGGAGSVFYVDEKQNKIVLPAKQTQFNGSWKDYDAPYVNAMEKYLLDAGYSLEGDPGDRNLRYYTAPPATTKTWSEYRSFYEDPETGKVTYGNWTTDQSKLGLSGD